MRTSIKVSGHHVMKEARFQLHSKNFDFVLASYVATVENFVTKALKYELTLYALACVSITAATDL